MIEITQNPNITWEIIQNNPDKKWSWFWIVLNSNITWEIIQNNSDIEWDLYMISYNTMKSGKNVWINNLRLKIIKVLQIQRHWRTCSSNPKYKLAQKLINNKLDN